VAGWLAPLQRHLGDAALGHIAESFDGDRPHQPAGRPASAIAVAEILRVTVEHLAGHSAALELEKVREADA
jgi:glycogen debranching enzyme